MKRSEQSVRGRELVAVGVLALAATFLRPPCEPESVAATGEKVTTTGTAGAAAGVIPAGKPASRHLEAVEIEAVVAGAAGRAEETIGAPADSGGAAGPVGSSGTRQGRGCPSVGESDVRLFASPARPWVGAALRVIAVSNRETELGGLDLVSGGDRSHLVSGGGWGAWRAWGGPPWGWAAVVESPAAGTHRVEALDAAGDPVACLEVEVAAEPPEPDGVLATGVWAVERAWNREMEALYAAWVQRLFLVDAGAKAGWRPLHQVFRDSRRNLLWGHLGLGEDDGASAEAAVAEPDCGDTPFFLRAYFAWKMRLPFAVRHCSRGDRKRGSGCDPTPETNLTPEWDGLPTEVARFNAFLDDSVGDTVHSGTGRQLPERQGEFYPVALARETLRPGTVFVDVGGHVLTVSRWVPGTTERLGMLLAVDGHPDRTVSHKRFSRANFFFDFRLRTGGFKAFRPVRYEDGVFRLATDDELRADPDYPDPSTEQYEFRSEYAFHRAVLLQLNPEPLDPVKAYRSHLEAMIELLEERVTAVAVGIEYQEANGWATIPMPNGGSIFETRGPWEDYSTPARDLRLLIALDETVDFKTTVFDNPGLFRIPPDVTPVQLERRLREEWNRSKDELGITYVRTDGSPWRLTLGEIAARIGRFEQSYNPNDCVELRWGALRNTEEFAPCVRHAPAEQRNRMVAYRHWHAERRRPSGF